MTWTCDYCGNPNLMEEEYCHSCGKKKPSRYGRRVKKKSKYLSIEAYLRECNDVRFKTP